MAKKCEFFDTRSPPDDVVYKFSLEVGLTLVDDDLLKTVAWVSTPELVEETRKSYIYGKFDMILLKNARF